MREKFRHVLGAIAAAAVLAAPAWAQAPYQVECESPSSQVKGVTFEGRVDGVPMRGHAPGFVGVPVPVVQSPVLTLEYQ